MNNWDPLQYLSFENERLRPALDLLNQIPLENPEIIYDIGCGPGNVTELLKKKWPNSVITGVDSSEEMLKKAKNLSKEISWILEDIDKWIPDEKPDLIYSNATLHWLDDHEKLFPKLLNHLNKNGVLAIQMPNNFKAPTHKYIFDTASTGPWAESLIPLIREAPVLDTSHYYRVLNPLSKMVNIWETIYLHFLSGENPVVEWTKGSVLRPYLNNLDENMKTTFLGRYSSKIQKFYSQEYDGKTLLPFKRLFLIAVKN